MGNNYNEKLRELEEVIDKLKLAKIRAEERLSLLRKDRDKLLKQLKDIGVSNPRDAKAKLTELTDQIDKAIADIEKQIPPNLDELLNDESVSDRKEV